MFDIGSQQLEIFLLPAVPTEHLDEHRQPHFPTSPNSVPTTQIMQKIVTGSWPKSLSTLYTFF